jgi:hypothetical protein
MQLYMPHMEPPRNVRSTARHVYVCTYIRIYRREYAYVECRTMFTWVSSILVEVRRRCSSRVERLMNKEGETSTPCEPGEAEQVLVTDDDSRPVT